MNSFNECLDCGCEQLQTSSTGVGLWDKCPRCSSTNTSGFKQKKNSKVQLLSNGTSSRIQIVKKKK